MVTGQAAVAVWATQRERTAGNRWAMAGITGAFYAVLGYLPPLSRVISPPETHVQAPGVARKTCASTARTLTRAPDPNTARRGVLLSVMAAALLPSAASSAVASRHIIVAMSHAALAI